MCVCVNHTLKRVWKVGKTLWCLVKKLVRIDFILSTYLRIGQIINAWEVCSPLLWPVNLNLGYLYKQTSQAIALFIAKVTSRNLCSVLWTTIANQKSNLVPHKRLHSIFWHLFLNSTKTLAHRMLCFVFVFFSFQYFCYSPAVGNMLCLWVPQTTSCDEDYLNCLFVEHSVRHRICCNNYQ